jgi:hypothetical protein
MSVVTIPFGMLSLLNFFPNRNYVFGYGWVDGKKPDNYDWALSFILASLLCIAWPLFLVYGTKVSVRSPSVMKELKREKKARKQQEAFDKLKEAQACISRAKRDQHRADTQKWEDDYYEADTERRAAIEQPYAGHTGQDYEYIFHEEEHMFDREHKRYGHPSYCRCYYCS